MDNLPTLTDKQQTFLLYYFSNGKNASDAYRRAFNSKAKDNTVWKNASKLLKSTKVTPWVDYYEKNQQEVIKDEINYTALDAFNEFNDMKDLAKKSKSTYGVAVKAIEDKAKLAGVFVEKHEITTKSLADVLDDLK